MQIPPCQYNTTGDYYGAITVSPNQQVRRVHTTICFVIWHERYRQIFTDKCAMVQEIKMEVKGEYPVGLRGSKFI